MAVAIRDMSVVGGNDIDHAASTIDRFIYADKQYCDLCVSLNTSRQTGESGLNDHDYPPSFVAADDRAGVQLLPELSTAKRVPLPNELVEEFAHMQCNCMMGLFTQISRAWLSIDSDIFIWNYENGEDLAYFDGLTETILCAGLVKPKPGIFQPHISHLLCLTTPVEIVLLGVTFTSPNSQSGSDPISGEMHLLPEPLYSLPSDNAHFLNVTGTEQGRIFLGAKDGFLYEVVYQAQDSWFSRKCRKINLTGSSFPFFSYTPSFLMRDEDPIVQTCIDERRRILYTLSERGSIQVFDLGGNGTEFSRVASMSENQITNNCSAVIKTVDRSIFKPVVCIAAVSCAESSKIHLVAISHTGVRMYFATCPLSDLPGRPSTLALVHVRLPPGFSANTTVQRPSRVHAAYYHRGTMLLAASLGDDVDQLWVISSDSFPFQGPRLMENQAISQLSGRTWALDEVPLAPVSWTQDPAMQGNVATSPPLVVTQHMEDPRKFVLLSAQGSYIVNKLRPVDQLRHLLVASGGPDSADVDSFFKMHKAHQACATALILACSNLVPDAQVAEWAARAFFLHGGEPHFVSHPLPSTVGPGYASAVPATPAGGGAVMSPQYASATQSPSADGSMAYYSQVPGGSSAFLPHQVSTPHPGQQAPSFQQQQLTAGTADVVTFSAKHDGFCLYLSRILGPLWNSKLVGDAAVRAANGDTVVVPTSRISADEAGWFIEHLLRLLAFANRSMQLSAQSQLLALSAESSTGLQAAAVAYRNSGRLAGYSQLDEQTKKRLQSDAQLKERTSLQQVVLLLKCCIEVLGLWRVLCEHQFHVIARRLPKELLEQARSMTFRQLLLQGREMCAALISRLVDQYLGDNAPTDAISSRLREVCPSLYSTDDALCSKANEMIQSAKTAPNAHERARLIKEANLAYKQVTAHIDVQSVCQQLVSVKGFDSILDLCLTAAAKYDPLGKGLDYYNNGEPADDFQGLQAYSARVDCYRCVTDVLSYLLAASQEHPHVPSVPTKPGPPSPSDPSLLTSAEAEQTAERMYMAALKVPDELFHASLYKWLINNDLTDKLIEINSPFLEKFLKRNVALHDSIETLDILWKYYEKTRNFPAAARILNRLADRPGDDVSLQERVEFLSRAIMSTKSATFRSGTGDGELLYELEEKLEVARIQLQVIEAIGVLLQTPDTQRAMKQLNGELFDITTLYSDFAQAFDLPECKLAIISAAGHYDVNLIERLWTDILTQEFKLHVSVDSQMQLVRQRMVGFASRYGQTDRYFPLAFLTKELELRGCAAGFASDSWACETLRECGVSALRLLDVYDKLFKAKDVCWKTKVQQPYHLLAVIWHLMRSVTESPSLVPAHERHKFSAFSQDAVSRYLVELQSSPLGDSAVKRLVTGFKDVQARLARLV